MDRDPRWLREGARKLSSLLQTPHEELDEFIRERLGANEGVTVHHLEDVRAILALLVSALEEPDESRWVGIAHARQSLESWEESRKRADPPASEAAAPAAAALAAAPPPPRPPASPAPAAWAPGAANAPLPGSSPWAPTPRPAAAPTAKPSSPQPTFAAELPHAGASALPFHAAVKAPPPRTSLEPHPALGQTAPTSHNPKSEPLPFASTSTAASASAPSGSPAASLTLEQYAQFCAEKALWPDHGEQIRQRYRLDPEAEKATERHFQSAFVKQPDLQLRFNQLFVEARRQLGG